jgi:hypothetical protein
MTRLLVMQYSYDASNAATKYQFLDRHSFLQSPSRSQYVLSGELLVDSWVPQQADRKICFVLLGYFYLTIASSFDWRRAQARDEG